MQKLKCKHSQLVPYALLLFQQILSLFHDGRSVSTLLPTVLLSLQSKSLDKHFLTFSSPSVFALLSPNMSVISNLIVTLDSAYPFHYHLLIFPLRTQPNLWRKVTKFLLCAQLYIKHYAYLFIHKSLWVPIISHLLWQGNKDNLILKTLWRHYYKWWLHRSLFTYKEIDSNYRGRGRVNGIIGEGPSRNMYNGHMDKAKGCRFEGGNWGWGGQGGLVGSVKMETTVLEKQQ